MTTLKDMLGKRTTNLSDETLVSDAMAAKAAGATALLSASLQCPTPELKQLFSGYMAQLVGEHTALTELALSRGWTKPYDQPENQLLETFNHSRDVLNSEVID